MIIPERPEDLLVEFLPRCFDDLAAPSLVGAAPLATEHGPRRRDGARPPAPVGVLVRVVSAGEWTLRIVSGRLEVTAGMAPDVALQLSLHARDFTPLVVNPLRRAEQALASRSAAAPHVAPTGGAVASSIWSRLARWDEETIDLVRRQEGRILVRVDDEGTSRNVALTPGVNVYSLEEAECIIECRLADLDELQAKRGNPLDLFYEGHIRITGDAQIALAMAGLFL